MAYYKHGDTSGTEALAAFILLIVCLFLTSCFGAHESNTLGQEVMQYNYIVINGVEYKTDDIENGADGFTWVDHYRANDEFYFYLKNGDKITFQEGNYTLKDKKS